MATRDILKHYRLNDTETKALELIKQSKRHSNENETIRYLLRKELKFFLKMGFLTELAKQDPALFEEFRQMVLEEEHKKPEVVAV